MQITGENILLLGSILLFLSIIASKTSSRLGIPALVLFLGIGMLAGSDGPGGIAFEDPVLSQFIGIVSLCFILFSGGFETKLESIKPVFIPGLLLSTLGVLVTAGLVGVFLHYSIDLPWAYSFLLGSIVSSTDAAAVFSIFRSKNMGLKPETRSLLEFESGSNDPMAFILMLSCLNFISTGDASLPAQFFFLIKQLSIGAAAGFALGHLGVFIINKISLGFEGLYSVLLTSLVLFAFSLTDLLGGNGFLAVYLCGIILSNNNLIHKKSLMKFFDGIAWMMQSVMFLTLGLLVFPSKLLPVTLIGLAAAVFIIFAARPAGVYISLLFSRFTNKQKLFISWAGLRGAVPIVFATYPFIYGTEHADLIFNIVFFIAITSVLIQGTTLAWVADKLGLLLNEQERKKTPLEEELSESIKSELMEFIIPAGSPLHGMQIVDLNFPRNAHIAMINHNGKYITPSGQTLLHERDVLVVMAEEREVLFSVSDILTGKKERRDISGSNETSNPSENALTSDASDKGEMS